MSKDINRISVNKFESLLKEDEPITVTIPGNEDLEVCVRKNVGFAEMLMIVNDIAETCVDIKNGDYMPQLYDFRLRCNVLAHYAGFAMPQDVEKQYRLVYETEAYNTVISVIDQEQVRSIMAAVDEKIQFMLSVMTSTTAMKISDVVDSMSSVSAFIEKAFGDMDTDQIASTFKALGALSETNEKDLAHAILEIHSEESNDG